MNRDSLVRLVTNLFQWYTAPGMPERGIECFLWVELFRKELKYPAKHIKVQKDHDTKGKEKYRPDIILNSSNFAAFAVEIKKPDLSKSAFINGRAQVAGYAKKLNMPYAIITDGVRWDVIAISQNRNQYRHIWSHRLVKSSDLSADFLLALRPKMIQRFFSYSDQIFGTIGYKKLHETAVKAAMSSKNLKNVLLDQPNASHPLMRLVNRQLQLYLLNKTEKPSGEWIAFKPIK